MRVTLTYRSIVLGLIKYTPRVFEISNVKGTTNFTIKTEIKDKEPFEFKLNQIYNQTTFTIPTAERTLQRRMPTNHSAGGENVREDEDEDMKRSKVVVAVVLLLLLYNHAYSYYTISCLDLIKCREQLKKPTG